MEFKLEDAIQALFQVCRQYKGTADDHDYLKFVINHIYKAMKGEPQAKPDLKPVPNDSEG